jgi:hypothetical protein
MPNTAPARLAALEARPRVEQYNYDRYGPGLLLDEARRTLAATGAPPGGEATDFELPQVDDLEGTVHEAFGRLTDPTYLVDRDGRVAFYNLWTNVPALSAAIGRRMAQGGRGIVSGGLGRSPQIVPALAYGWPAPACRRA